MKLQTKLAGLTLLLVNLTFFNSTNAQNTKNQPGVTPGNLTFTVKTITNNSAYSPRNVLAIWIKDAQGNFVVSRKVMASARKQHLVKWNASSAGNSVSAITGATLASHQTHTITWDGKNAAKTDMPDGIYQIWVEYVSTNAASNGNQGPYLSVEFNKGSVAQHITPANATYFQNIVSDWVPLTAGLNDISKSGAYLRIYPNPFKSETKLELVCNKPSQAYISVYDVSGQKAAVLLNDSFDAGTRIYTWDGSSDNGRKLANGLYLVHISINGYSEIQKVFLNR